MKSSIREAIHKVDVAIAPLLLSAFKEQNSLNTYLFHALFKDKEEISQQLVDPQQQVTVELFRQFVEYHLEKGYKFVSPNDILKGLDLNEKFIMITFDDGYYNNIRALPILEEYQVPAVFFISVNHIIKGKAFWWDVVYREGKRNGESEANIKIEKDYLLKLRDDQIDEYIINKYGINSLMPIGDTDRPFNPDELRDFAKHPQVVIGNHTCDHAVLTNYNNEGISKQIIDAQTLLHELVGYKPKTIAYPCGEYNNHVLQVSENIGIELGITINHAKNSSENFVNRKNMLTLNRFTIWGTEDIKSQSDYYRSDFHFLDSIRGVYHKLKGV